MKISDIIPYLSTETNAEIGKRFNKSASRIASYITMLKKAGYKLPERKTGRRPMQL